MLYFILFYLFHCCYCHCYCYFIILYFVIWFVCPCVLGSLSRKRHGEGLGWLYPPHWLSHSTCCRCALCSGSPPTCLFSVSGAYFHGGITFSGGDRAIGLIGYLATAHHSAATCVVRGYSFIAGPPTRSSVAVGLEPVPARLVQRIRGGHFIEMRDLLGDNIALTQHFESAADYFPTVLPSSERPHLREVSSLLSWVYCFLTYLAVLVQDQTVRDRLVYARLIVHEALCHRGWGWLDYDCLFRQQAALDPSLHWGSLHPSLMASTVLSQRSGTGSFCSLCQGCDHTPSDCAMTFLRHPVCQGPPSRSTQICLSWNDGHCAATPGPCFRLHVCATCGSPHHRAKECRDTPPDSRFKNPSKRGRFSPPPGPTPGITLRLCGTPCRIGDYVFFSITSVF